MSSPPDRGAEQRQQRLEDEVGHHDRGDQLAQVAPGEGEAAGEVAGDQHERRHVPGVEERVDRRCRRTSPGSRVHECPITTRVTSSIFALSKKGSRDDPRAGGLGRCSVGASVRMLSRSGDRVSAHVPLAGLAETRAAARPRLLDSGHARRPRRPDSPPQRQRVAAYAVLGAGRRRDEVLLTRMSVARPASRAGGRCPAAASTTARTRATRWRREVSRRPACTSSRARVLDVHDPTSSGHAPTGSVEDYHGIHLIFARHGAAAVRRRRAARPRGRRLHRPGRLGAASRRRSALDLLVRTRDHALTDPVDRPG